MNLKTLTLTVSILLLFSIALNIYLYYVSTQLQSNLENAEELIRSLNEKVLNLTSSIEQLKAERDYYKNLSMYYIGGFSSNTTGLHLSSRRLTALAVRMIPEGFSYRLEGITMNITCEVTPGEGRILVNTQPRMGVDFQSAARTAVEVASKISGVDLSGSDIIFSIEAPAEVYSVDGPSAGAAMTVLLLSMIYGEELNSSVAITGTVMPDGSVGPVGGVYEKTLAAVNKGIKLILVPPGESKVIIYKTRERKFGPFTIIERYPVQVDLNNVLEGKAKVIEVSSVSEAYEYFKLQQK